MFSHFHLHLRKIEDLADIAITGSHIFKRCFAVVALLYLMSYNSIRIIYLPKKVRVVAFLSATLFLASVTKRSSLVFERVRGRRLVGVVAVSVEASFKLRDSLSQRGNLKLLLSDYGKKVLDKLDDSLRAAIINSSNFITVHHRMKTSTQYYRSGFDFSASG
jgi:hypothetical protein